jgi:hypothetical protein
VAPHDERDLPAVVDVMLHEVPDHPTSGEGPGASTALPDAPEPRSGPKPELLWRQVAEASAPSIWPRIRGHDRSRVLRQPAIVMAADLREEGKVARGDPKPSERRDLNGAR